jgi:hypothetical protein
MKKEWVQVFIAIAVALTAGAVIRVADVPAQLGSLGEWVSGIGSFMAAGLALWIADSQRRHAIEQFAQERAHAAEMAAEERRIAAESVMEERRYQETLMRMDQEDDARRKKSEDHRTAHWMMSNIGPAVRTIISYSNSTDKSPHLYKHFCKMILDSKTVIHADLSLSKIGFNSFHYNETSFEAAEFIRSWNVKIGAFHSLSSDTEWGLDKIKPMMDLKSLKMSTQRFVAHIIMIDPETTDFDDGRIQKHATEWTDNLFRN